MTVQKFYLRPDLTTRQVNAAVRAATRKYCDRWNIGVEPNEERRRYATGRVDYVFGIGNELRDTLVASYEPGNDYIELCFPNGYRNWLVSDSYTRLRVAIRDEIVYRSNIIDRAKSPSPKHPYTD